MQVWMIYLCDGMLESTMLVSIMHSGVKLSQTVCFAQLISFLEARGKVTKPVH